MCTKGVLARTRHVSLIRWSSNDRKRGAMRPGRWHTIKSLTALRLLAMAATLSVLVESVESQVLRRDVIRGRVITDSGAIVVNARISVTRLPDQGWFRGVSDQRGAFEVVVDSGTGDYVVHVSVDSSTTLVPYRVRVQRKNEIDSIFVVRAVLSVASGQTLPTVTVSAERPAPERYLNVLERSIGGVERPVLGLSAATMPELRGDLEALAGTVPGVSSSPSGLSALGIVGQNSTTMNGLAFAGASVPRDIRFTTRVSTSTFDPSRGWFGGAETSVQIEPGSMLRSLRASATFDNPAVQSGDKLASRLGQQYSSAIASLGGDGYTASDRLAYSFGIQVSKKTLTVLPPSSLDSAVLQRVGLATDSASRAIQALTALSVPLSLQRGSPDGTVTSTASVLARFNTPEFVSKSNVLAKRSLGLILYASHEGRDGFGASPLLFATRESENRQDVASAQAIYSTTTAHGVVQSLRSTLSRSRESSTPLIDFPSGNVMVSSTFSDGTKANAQLGFGGASGRSLIVRSTWESQWRTAFYLKGLTRHLLEFTTDARFDRVLQDDASGSAGAFYFADLDALSQNRPSSFLRNLVALRSRGQVWNGFIAASDSWKPSARVRILLGVRAEANFFSGHPAANPAIGKSFGVRNDFVPNKLNLSPRFGFSWRYSNEPSVSGYFRTDLGALPIIATGILRGGFGKFTAIMSPGLIGGPSSATGLTGVGAQISCFGPTAPQPDWQAFGRSLESAPSACETSSGSSSLEDNASTVRLIDRQFSVSESWRANIGWTARRSWLLWSLDATFAKNSHQASELDLNFANAPRFFTADENRPVYVSQTGIVAATGAVSPTESRVLNTYGRVLQTRSDLSGDAKQLVLTLVPNVGTLTGRVFTSISYTLGSSRSAQRGFDYATFGSPVDRVFQRTVIDTRHSVLVQGGLTTRYATISIFGRFASGTPFTPLLQTDVNGDGLANDIAYIFDPTKLTDGDFSRDLRTLFVSAPSYARRCLADQIGRPATANSCTGPWTTTVNASLASKRLPWHDAVVSLSFFNLPAALDQWINTTRLAGWGSAATPDPILFTTYGFNATTRKFLYRVNPRFGDSRGMNLRSLSPFRVNLDVRLNLGPSESVQLVRRLVNAGRKGRRDVRLDVSALVPRLRRSGPQPYREMLELADSLFLTGDQLIEIAKAEQQLTTRADSVWTDLATWLAALPDQFDEATAVGRQESATDRVWEIARQHVQFVLRPLLTRQQVALLPWPTNQLFESAKPLKGMRIVDYRDP